MPEFTDLHCDTLTAALRSGDKLLDFPGRLSLKKLGEFDSPVQFFAVWPSPGEYREPMHFALRAIRLFYLNAAAHRDILSPAFSLRDIGENARAKKISALLSFEGAEPLLGDPDMLDIYYRLGVRMLSLTWNYENPFAAGHLSAGGLSERGRELVKKMNALGVITDVSHLNEEGFFDVAAMHEAAGIPFIASHSNVRALCDDSRNLTDAQILAIKASGGIMGLNLYPEFLAKGRAAGIKDVLSHAEHILELAGEDVPALGCDLDGFSCAPAALRDVRGIKNLLSEFERHFGEKTMKKIACENALRVISRVLK
ncbi:MAG: membrane dipeptidase [Firmicutes bacterium]|nr:membrane dipeptidase [Bacillota bacterium]